MVLRVLSGELPPAVGCNLEPVCRVHLILGESIFLIRTGLADKNWPLVPSARLDLTLVLPRNTLCAMSQAR
jgi:hypothetical protein